MIVTPTEIPDVLIVEPNLFADDRGWFFESFNQKDFSSAIGKQITFVQDNHSLSRKGVIRGMHYQTERTQGKLVRVCRGAVFDVAVDLRQLSITYGRWVGVELTADNKKQLWIPPGFAHGFLVLSDEAELLYKVTEYRHIDSEQCIHWGDLTIGINWPIIGENPVINSKDALGLTWLDAPKF